MLLERNLSRLKLRGRLGFAALIRVATKVDSQCVLTSQRHRSRDDRSLIVECCRRKDWFIVQPDLGAVHQVLAAFPITDGKGKMPAFKGKLKEAEIDAVVKFIRTLKK